MNDTAMPIIIALALVALPLGAGYLYFRRRNMSGMIRSGIHPLLILGIIFLFPGFLSLGIEGEESVFLSLGVIFTISGITAQILLRTPPDNQDRRQILTGSLLGFAIGAGTGAVLSLVFMWSPILMIVFLGALGLLGGVVAGRFFRRDVQV